MKLTEAQKRMVLSLAARLEEAGHGARTAIVAEAAAAWGRSVDTVWRWLRSVRPSGREVRSDLGRTRHDPAQLRQVLLVKQQTRFTNKRTGVEMVAPTEQALEIARSEGRVTSDISRSAVDRYAARVGLGSQAVRRLTRLKRSAAPNDMHVLDCSGSKLLVFDRWDGQTARLRVRPEEGYTRKRQDQPLGVWLVGVVDHCSGVAWAEYAVANGESFELVLNFLRGPWGGDPRCDLRGLPAMLNADHGPFIEHQKCAGLLAGLDVKLLGRMPNTPNVGGAVERSWRTLWGRFEAANFARTRGREMTLAEANQELAVYLRAWNRHAQWLTGEPKLSIYQRGLADVRVMPEDVLGALFSGKVRRVLPGGVVRLGNEFYRLPDSWAGRWVEMLVSDAGESIARHGETGETTPVAIAKPSTWDEYEERHDTPWQRLEKEAAADLAAGNARPAFAAEAGNVVTFTPAARTVEPETPFTAARAAARYANMDEGMERGCLIIGFDRVAGEPEIVQQLRRLIEVCEFDKEKCDAAFFKLRDGAG